MDRGGQAGGLAGRQALGPQTRDDAGQDIAHTAAGHAWIAADDDPDGALPVVDERPSALEQDDAAIAFAQGVNGREAIGLDRRGRRPEEAGRLTGMGRQDPVVMPDRGLRQAVQGVGIDDPGAVPGQHGLEERPRPGPAPQARADRNDGRPFEQRGQIGRGGDGVAHRLGQQAVEQGRMAGMACDRHEPGARAQRGPGRQAHGPEHARGAADDETMPEHPLVGMAGTSRQEPPALLVGEAFRRRWLLVEHGGRQIQGCVIEPAGIAGRLAGQQALLERDEAERPVGRQGHAEDATGIAVDPRRDIEREDRRGMRVAGLDGRAPGALDGTGQAAAEEGVDDQVGPGEAVRPEPLEPPALALEARQGASGIAAGRPVAGTEDADRQAGLPREAGHDEPVPAIVAGAGDDDDPTGLWPLTTQGLEGRTACPLHEFAVRDTEALDGPSVEPA